MSEIAPALEEEDGDERRREPRLRSLLPGTLVFDDKRVMDCMVRSISAHGAKITMPDAYRLPDSLDLRIPHHDQVHRAKVVWRKNDVAGFELADPEKIVHQKGAHALRKEAQRDRQKQVEASQF
jgi:hypothetical protein